MEDLNNIGGRLRLWWIIPILGLYVACSQKQSVLDTAVVEEFERLKSNFQKEAENTCTQQILVRAEAYVDSILGTLELGPLKGSGYEPELPVKPSFVPVDSVVFIDTLVTDPE